MRLAIIGASGNAGTRIVAEALARGHSVTAIGRNRDKLDKIAGTSVAVADMTDPAAMAALLAGHDVIISAVRFIQYDPEHLILASQKSGVGRLIVVGGAGTLMTGSGLPLAQTPAFPEIAKPEAAGGKAVLERLRADTTLEWTFISPSAIFVPGERTGAYRVGKDDLLVGENGQSRISMEDYAIAVLDEAEKPKHVSERFTVGY
ncbi:NAD(P)-dependent oxidoreductase [Mesorhizobium sp. CO1-1-8]|uniref:NAD(P)-dependent oxidoreductase n=1 Tax=Mesorhizobium sp. CO1-1-8 TaxID=2876631 RepID=UPI001CD080DA|nr:NAD(P)-dependent oxidoreductase [Mesorhizobium sp. CO1-1-8]MBZ9772425.1 NAD(P)-dependent oxidoreductase [Mesorhizobium sp. CO1-1-8]